MRECKHADVCQIGYRAVARVGARVPLIRVDPTFQNWALPWLVPRPTKKERCSGQTVQNTHKHTHTHTLTSIHTRCFLPSPSPPRMNADAYLRKQGWKGSGHSLDATGRGIKKPLLIAHKQDQLGLGKKKAAYTTDDQWWMRAFDQSLQSIGTGKESTLSQIRTKGINRGGLYGFFVKGESIAGTIDDSSATDNSRPQSGISTPCTAGSTSASDAERPAYGLADKRLKRRLAKLKPTTRAEYESRAAVKGQTLEQYLLRRICKKDDKRAANRASFKPTCLRSKS